MAAINSASSVPGSQQEEPGADNTKAMGLTTRKCTEEKTEKGPLYQLFSEKGISLTVKNINIYCKCWCVQCVHAHGARNSLPHCITHHQTAAQPGTHLALIWP